MRLILLGCPGAGKGTQSKFIAERYHLPAISTGDIFRGAIQAKTPLGVQVKKIVEEGSLVSDDIVIQLVAERLSHADCQQGFLLDGFPRTVLQAQALEKMVTIDAVINIDVPEAEIIKRLTGRRIHPASGRTYHLSYQPPKIANQDDVTGEALIQRPDDQEEAVRKRLQIYHQQTSPLHEYYLSRHPKPFFLNIEGSKQVTAISEAIFKHLDLLSKNSDASTSHGFA